MPETLRHTVCRRTGYLIALRKQLEARWWLLYEVTTDDNPVTVYIVKHWRDDGQQAPPNCNSYKLTEDSNRVVAGVMIIAPEADGVSVPAHQHYQVTNPQHVFSYGS